MSGNNFGTVSSKLIKVDQAWQLENSTNDLIFKDLINSNIIPITIKSNSPVNSIYVSTTGVGIGTIPAIFFHVAGATRVTGSLDIRYHSNIGVHNGLILGTADKATSGSGGQGSFGIFSNDLAASQLQGTLSLVTSATAEQRRLALSVIEQGTGYRNITLAESGGNVGIGVITPSIKLTVGGGFAVQGNGYPTAGAGWEMYTDSGVSTSYINSYNRTGGAWLNAQYGGLSLMFHTSGAERMRVDTNGNFSVNTTGFSSAGKVMVAHSDTATNRIFGMSVNTGVRLMNSSATAGNYTYIMNVNSANTLSSLIAFVNEDHNTPNTAGSIEFVVRNGASLYQPMKIAYDSNIYINNAVGTFTGAKVRIESTSAGGETNILNLINNSSSTNTACSILFTPNINVELGKIKVIRTNSPGAGGTDMIFYNYNGGLVEKVKISNTHAIDASGIGRFISPNSGTTGAIVIRENASGGSGIIQFVDNTNAAQRAYILCTSNGRFQIAPNGSETLTLENNGYVYFRGYTSGVSGTQASYTFHYAKNAEWCINCHPTDSDAGGGGPMLFTNVAKTGIGSISASSTNVGFNTSSDYRLKKDVLAMQSVLTKIASLNPCTFTWKLDNSHGEGFLAHEVQELFPLAVYGEKDAVDLDGNIQAQGIDFSKLVPYLVKGMQEILVRLETAGI